jgi:hypothetical protein
MTASISIVLLDSAIANKYKCCNNPLKMSIQECIKNYETFPYKQKCYQNKPELEKKG